MANYMYIRVSSKTQNTARQFEDVAKLNIPEENIFVDKQSGKNFDRPEYKRMIQLVNEGDVIYFHSIDRMGRNYDDILTQWQYITKELKADIVILDMPLLNTTVKGSDLTGKLIADIVLQLLSYVAQRERENINIRQREGIDLAMAQGKYEKKDIDMDRVAEMKKEIEAGRLSVSAAAKELGITRVSMYRRLDKV